MMDAGGSAVRLVTGFVMDATTSTPALHRGQQSYAAWLSAMIAVGNARTPPLLFLGEGGPSWGGSLQCST